MVGQYIRSLFGRGDDEPFVSIDIGTSAIKLMVLDLSSSRPRLLGVAVVPTPAHAITNHTVVKPEQVGQAIRAALETNDIKAKRAVFALPGPCAFTKKISIPYASLKDLEMSISFEARNYIPHNIGAVRLDFQVLKTNAASTMEVLLVAVKNEIVDSYVAAVTNAGLEPAIADVDYFALENMFELSYPEDVKRSVCLVNVGARYTSVNLIDCGESVFTGDVGVGGRLFTDALCETLGLEPLQAEQAKSGEVPDGVDVNLLQETLDRTTEHLASEIQRQLGFFWNAAATDRSIEAIYMSGGGAQVSGLVEELSTKTGIPCSFVDAFRGVQVGDDFDADYLAEVAPAMAVSVGLAGRRFGDKRHAVE